MISAGSTPDVSQCLSEITAPGDAGRLPEQMLYRIADRTIIVEALDEFSREVVAELFADWYLLSQDAHTAATSPSSVIRIRSKETPPAIPHDFNQFAIAGEGLCYSQGSLSYIDIQGSRIAIGLPGMAEVEIWLNGITAKRSPQATRLISYALSSALRRCDLFELHSAGVVDPESGRGVLIIGASGSGKSTLTVQLAAAGWSYLSDDVLMVNGAGGDIEAWSLRRCFSVTAETVAASRSLHSSAALFSPDSFNESKQRFSPQEVFGAAFRESCIPQSLLFSEVITGDASHLTRLSAADVMARLIRMSPWSCYDAQTASAHLAVFARLAKQTKGFALFAGKDLLDHEYASRFIGEYVRN